MKKTPIFLYLWIILVMSSCHQFIEREQRSISEDNEKIFSLQGTHDLVLKDSFFAIKQSEDGNLSQKIFFSWEKNDTTTYLAYVDPAKISFKVRMDSSTHPTVTFIVKDYAYFQNAILYTGDGALQDHISNFVKLVVIKYNKKDSVLFKLN